MHRIDTDGHVSNLFNEGDPLVPRMPTQIDKHWLNAVQEELVSIVLDADSGIGALVKGTNTQVLAALKSILVTRTVAQTITALKTFAAGLTANGKITGTAGISDTGNANLDIGGFFSKGVSSVGVPAMLEPQGSLPTAGLEGRLAVMSGKLYIDNGTAWVVVGTQT
jgi:hypothetical protein